MDPLVLDGPDVSACVTGPYPPVTRHASAALQQVASSWLGRTHLQPPGHLRRAGAAPILTLSLHTPSTDPMYCYAGVPQCRMQSLPAAGFLL